MSARAAAVAISAGVIAAAVGCNALLQNEGDAYVSPQVDVSADASTSACGIAAGDTTCQTCLQSDCCPESAACAGTPACAAYESCVVPCAGNAACRARCAELYRTDAPESAALDQCLAAHCQTACGVQCGITSAYTSADAAAACEACVVASGDDCRASQACATNVACVQLAGCTATCPTPDCQSACFDANDAGTALFETLTTALAGTCLAECQYGAHWDCIGRVTNPLPKSAVALVDVTVQDILGSSPIAGAQVTACDVEGLCSPPLASGTTDATGNVALEIPQGPGGFGGYLEISASGYEPVLYFLAYRLSEPRSSIAVSLLTQADLSGLVSAAGVKLDDSRGVVVVGTADCALENAAGVQVRATGIDATTDILYFLADQSLSSTADATDRSAAALLVNVPTTSTIELSAVPLALGRASSTATVFVSAGAVSYVTLLPD